MKKLISYISLLLFIFLSLTACGTGGGSGDDRKNSLPDPPLVVFQRFLTKLISLHSDGTQGNNDSANPFMNSTGRFVVFESQASNLVTPNTTALRHNIFIHDRDVSNDSIFDQTNDISTTLTSKNSNGNEGNGNSFNPAISDNGQFVVFESNANNLVTPITSGLSHIFIHDRDDSGNTIFDEPGDITTKLVSAITGSTVEGNGHSFSPTVSADGRFVAFASESSDLLGLGNDQFGFADIFVRDTVNDTTTIVSVDSNGNQGNSGNSFNPFISSTGRFVVFESKATNLVPQNTLASRRHIFLHDRDVSNDTIFDDITDINTSLISITPNNLEGNGNSFSPSVSADGRFVAFESNASNLLGGPGTDQGGYSDIFVRDLINGTTTLVSVASNGVQGRNDSFNPSISEDGRFVVFESKANNLVAQTTLSGRRHIFLHNRDVSNDGFFDELGDISTELVSVTTESTTEGNGNSFNPTVSTDGRFVAFDSVANNLLGGPGTDQGGYRDIFVRDRDP